jgi:hypothetical protein
VKINNFDGDYIERLIINANLFCLAIDGIYCPKPLAFMQHKSCPLGGEYTLGELPWITCFAV